MSRAQILTVIAVAMALTTSGRAADGTITFTGAVTGNSCTVQVDGTGGGDGAVALPVVDAAALNDSSAPHDTAAGTFFNISLSGCVATHADLSGVPPTGVAIYFEAGPNVDLATHGLINAGTSNVEVKLYLASEANVVGLQITPGTAGTGQPASHLVTAAATQYFYAGYSLTDGAQARSGTVSTSVTYSLIYN